MTCSYWKILPIFLYLLEYSSNNNAFSADATSSGTSTSTQKFESSRWSDFLNASALNNIFGGLLNRKRNTIENEVSCDSETDMAFDYIVVGCGSAGCPLARTLADGGKRVLLIERGRERSAVDTPNAWDVYGAGMAIADETVSQPILTEQGVRTHTGFVMGGGSSVNMGIMIEETEEYFDYVEREFPGNKWDRELIKQSYKWVRDKIYNVMPQTVYGDAFREGLRALGFKPPKGAGKKFPPSFTINPGGAWGGVSLFDSKKGYYRAAADALLGKKEKRPPTLKVLAEHVVEKVIFDKSEGTPQATCVLYRKTKKEDHKVFGVRTNPMSSLFSSIYQRIERFWFPETTGEHTACIEKGGEIIISAGAVLTPALLFKSGVGPREQIEELGIDLVYEIPELGKNFSDRCFVPVAMFYDDPKEKEIFHQPSIVQTVGIKTFGPHCESYKIGDRTLKCSNILYEELQGSAVMQGTVVGTRFIFPPAWRNIPFMNFSFKAGQRCYETGNDSSPVCVFLNPIFKCLRQATALFYFTAEPKSRGHVKMTRSGDIEVTANYMKDPQDLFDAIRGVQGLMEIVNGDFFKGKMQQKGPDACPLTIMNGFYDFVLALIREEVEVESELIEEMELLRQHQHDFEPQLNSSGIFAKIEESLKRMYELDSVENDDKIIREFADLNIDSGVTYEEKLQKIWEKQKKLAETFGKSPLLNSHKTITIPEFDALQDEKSCEITCTKEESNNSMQKSCVKQDIYELIFSKCDCNKSNSDVNKISFLKSEFQRKMEVVLDQSEFWQIAEKSGNLSPIASYPPNLPDTNNPEELARYVLSYMTSVWHHAGTAAMGVVVDDEFKVKGLESLSIVDASIINQMTRINPTSTLMMIGRYAGIVKLRKKAFS